MDTKLKDKKEVAVGTMEFIFEKPAGFEYKSGQSIDLTLVNPPETDAEGNTRAYSLVSAPHEDFLAVATRLRDTAFKRVLRNLEPGAELTFEGPFGDMTLHNDVSKAAVFLAGGIGITPFYSMVKDAAQRQTPHKIFLFTSNHKPADAPFLTELQELQAKNPNYKLIATMTDLDGTPWEGEQGYITKEMITKYLPDMTNAIYYIAGPSAMVKAMHEMVNAAGVNDDYVRIEEFTGY